MLDGDVLLSSPTIAVVSDDTQFLRMMHVLLEAEGYDAPILFAEENAFEELCKCLPDLIVLDIRMEKPDSGWKVLDLETLERSTAQIPVIACSAAHDDLLKKQEYLDELGIRILLKPFKVEILLSLVEEMLAVGSPDDVIRAPMNPEHPRAEAEHKAG
jgi:CheY-like chemotaxis protein